MNDIVVSYICSHARHLKSGVFLNRKTLFEDCPEYFNNETGLLEAPLVIRVADQVGFLQYAILSVFHRRMWEEYFQFDSARHPGFLHVLICFQH